MQPETCGLHVAGPGGDLSEEWQVLVMKQALTLAALVSRMQTTVATRRRGQAPVARGQARAAEAKRVLTAQGQVAVPHDGDSAPDQRRRLPGTVLTHAGYCLFGYWKPQKASRGRAIRT
jgi:hypothetical protein